MIISHQNKYVFLHCKKTGGTSIEKALSPYLGVIDVCTGSQRDRVPRRNCPILLRGHLPYGKVKLFFPDWNLSNFKWWCVERNSYEKAFSDWWFHRSIIRSTTLGFEDFVERTENISDWRIYYGEGKFQAEVIQYDRLYERWPSLLKELSLPACIDLASHQLKKAGTLRPSIHRFCTPKAIELVKRKFHNEIEAFGYEPPKEI